MPSLLEQIDEATLPRHAATDLVISSTSISISIDQGLTHFWGDMKGK